MEREGRSGAAAVAQCVRGVNERGESRQIDRRKAREAKWIG